MPADTYGTVVNTPVGRFVARRAGLPRPVELERHSPGDPVIRGPVLLGAAPGRPRLTDGPRRGAPRGGRGRGAAPPRARARGARGPSTSRSARPPPRRAWTPPPSTP